ncbi:FimD/PapC N-terminal domain-containing protein, partial [Burkholderia cenocepacia]|uniref:FimD/PapC N-terminal domain-containing protein n=1 Tax=Burkholderia cenocepacia TaxID=95486 RepID=UPI001E3DF0BC
MSSPPRLKPVYALVLSSLAAWSTEGHADALEPAQPAVERIQLAQTDFAQATFDPGFLNNGSGQAVDLSRFSRGNVVQPGTYSVDLVVGSDWVGRYDITFNGAPGTPDAQPCFDE